MKKYCVFFHAETAQHWVSVSLIFLQSSSIDFLVSQNFDFNKVFREGTFLSALKNKLKLTLSYFLANIS